VKLAATEQLRRWRIRLWARAALRRDRAGLEYDGVWNDALQLRARWPREFLPGDAVVCGPRGVLP
jgi:hypothetical protein